MDVQPLPRSADDVLGLPKTAVPNVIRRLSNTQGFSALVSHIHAEQTSDDPARRARADAALRHLGFTD